MTIKSQDRGTTKKCPRAAVSSQATPVERPKIAVEGWDTARDALRFYGFLFSIDSDDFGIFGTYPTLASNCPTGIRIFLVEWGVKELPRVSQPHDTLNISESSRFVSGF